MATMDQVSELRLLTDLPEDTAPYTDEYLAGLIDEHGVESASVILWRQKAAKYSSLVDMSESGSSRRLSQLRDAALQMAKVSEPTNSRAPYTLPIVRP